jgi:flagellar motor protein MotB
MASNLKRFGLTSAMVLITAISVVGCGPDAKTQKIDELTAENDKLKQDLEDRDRQMNDAMVRENDARGTIDDLNNQLARMRADGSKKSTDGWVTMKSFDMISIPGAVLFDSGKAKLTAAGRSKLSQIASEIRSRYSDRDIYVFGHTDDDPIRKSKWRDNLELGAHRSLEVVRAMREFGIPNDSLVQANCGEYRPRVSNGGERNKAQNRRVEFYAVPKRGNDTIEDKTASGTSEE